MTTFKNKSLSVSIYSDRKQIGKIVDSFIGMNDLKAAVKAKYPSATSASLTDLNDADFYKEISL